MSAEPEQVEAYGTVWDVQRMPNGEYTAIDPDIYDGAPDGGNLMGWGSTPEDAIADLLEKLERTQ